MPQAVTHLVIAVVVLTLIREHFVKKKKDFPIYYVFIGGLAGLLPDIDIAVYWLLYAFGFNYDAVHRTFTHNLFFPVVLFIFSGLTKNLKSFKIEDYKLKWHLLFFVIALGVFVHLLLDMIIAGGIMPFYPFDSYKIGFQLANLVPEGQLRILFFPTLDAILLILWISYLEYKHKISSYF